MEVVYISHSFSASFVIDPLGLNYNILVRMVALPTRRV